MRARASLPQYDRRNAYAESSKSLRLTVAPCLQALEMWLSETHSGQTCACELASLPFAHVECAAAYFPMTVNYIPVDGKIMEPLKMLAHVAARMNISERFGCSVVDA